MANAGLVDDEFFRLTDHFHIEVVRATLQLARLLDEHIIYLLWLAQIISRLDNEKFMISVGERRYSPRLDNIREELESIRKEFLTQNSFSEAGKKNFRKVY